ncbi:MAG: hypothetical protein HRU10_05150 [Opitutales bacterium]|nr:hypothetical protein [Opitutales bacterium]
MKFTLMFALCIFASTLPGSPQRFVAIGLGTDILYSDNVSDWKHASVPIFSEYSTEHSLLDLASGNGRFVAVGGDFEKGRIVFSADGETWQNLPPRPKRVSSIAFCNGRFVAIEGNRFIISEDGEHWETGARLPDHLKLTPLKLAFGNNTFVLIGTHEWSETGYLDNGFKATTTNGEKIDSFATQQKHARDIIFRENHFLTVGRRELCERSMDGKQWQLLSFNPYGNDFRAVIDDGLHLIAEGGAAPFISTDGSVWKRLSIDREKIRVAPRAAPRILWSDGEKSIAAAWESLFLSEDPARQSWRNIPEIGASIPKDPETGKGTSFHTIAILSK